MVLQHQSMFQSVSAKDSDLYIRCIVCWQYVVLIFVIKPLPTVSVTTYEETSL